MPRWNGLHEPKIVWLCGDVLTQQCSGEMNGVGMCVRARLAQRVRREKSHK